ncbi:MAG: HAD family hydrolase [Elainella sp. Prado103]|nr:HAD family hydrolase [Elainella sp. Prado103]
MVSPLAIKVIVFDLDDTLFPEREFVYSGFQAVGRWMFETYQIIHFFEVAWDLFQQGKRGLIFNQTLELLGIQYQSSFIQTLVQIYRDHDPVIQLHPDARWAIDHYRRSHYLGIITNGFLKTQQNKIAALGIENCFDRIIYCDLYGRSHWKPSPLPYQKMMESLGLAGKSYVYIGDHPSKDFVAARQLGWLTFRICRPDGEHTQCITSTDQDAHFKIDSLYELQDLLGQASSTQAAPAHPPCLARQSSPHPPLIPCREKGAEPA